MTTTDYLLCRWFRLLRFHSLSVCRPFTSHRYKHPTYDSGSDAWS